MGMNKKKNKTMRVRTKGITVNDFNTDVWNAFAGTCRVNGLTIREVLEPMVSRWTNDNK